MSALNLKNTIKSSLARYATLIKKGSPFCLIIIIFNFLNSAFILPDIAPLQMGIHLDTIVPILPRLTLFLTVMLFIYIYTLSVVGFFNLNHEHKDFLSFFKSNFFPLVTDITRAFNKIILFLFLFIIPGLYKSIRLLFVPYAVMEAKKNGSSPIKDTLLTSEALTVNKKVQLFLFVIYLISIPCDFLAGMAMQKHTLISALMIATFNTIYPLFYHNFMSSVFLSLTSARATSLN